MGVVHKTQTTQVVLLLLHCHPSRPHEALPLLKIVAAWDAIQAYRLQATAADMDSSSSQLTQHLRGVGLAAAAAAAEGRSTLPPGVHMKALGETVKHRWPLPRTAQQTLKCSKQHGSCMMQG
jgi:hypothetical protein